MNGPSRPESRPAAPSSPGCARRPILLTALLLAGLSLGGCGKTIDGSKPAPIVTPPRGERPATSPAPSSPSADESSKALASFNRGTGLLEQYKYAEASKELQKVVAAFPDWTAARFNLGLALLNLPDDAEAVKQAEVELNKVIAKEPDHRWARFCLGVLEAHRGDYAKAAEHYARVYQADPDDPFVGFEYAEALRKLERNDEALKVLEKVVEQDPGFVSAFYSLGMLYNQMRQREKAVAVLNRFRDLKPQELAVGSYGVVSPYAGRGKYYTGLGADGLPIPVKPMNPSPRVLFSPEIRKLGDPLAAWAWPGGKVNIPGLSAGDVDGDGDQDLVISGAGPDGLTVLLINDGKGAFAPPVKLAERGVSPSLGDVDNDGDLDLWLGRAGQDQLLLNDGKGRFKPAADQPEPAGEQLTACARLVDLDSDGDLDLMSLRVKSGAVPGEASQAASPSRLFNNNANGKFADQAKALGLELPDWPGAAVVFDDFDGDRDIDLVLVSPSKPPIVWENHRVGRFRTRDAKASGLDVTGALSVTTGNPFRTGRRDLLISTGKEVLLFHNRGGWKFERDSEFAARFAGLGGTGGQFADIDNDGDLDIVIFDAHRKDGSRGPALLLNDWPNQRFVDASEADPGNLLSRWKCDGDAAGIVADFNGDGTLDILVAASGSPPVVFDNATRGTHWLALDLKGQRGQDQTSRSSVSSIGARVEFRSGNVSQQYVVGTPSGGTAVPPLRIHAGLGDFTSVDWLRIHWPDSLLQAELEVTGNRVLALDETCRRTSSCPHLFAWDGRRFAFVSDFGGVGGLGYRTGPSSFARPDPTEYVLLPKLAEQGGEYVLQVVEPLEEVVYFDEAKLIAVDHPIGTTIHPHEMAAVAAEPPPFEVFCYRESSAILPVRAVDARGADVTEALARTDRVYAEPAERDRRFLGFAKEHFVELDFGDRLKSLPEDARRILFLDGWVEYSTSTSNYAAGQAGLRLKAPSVLVEREGRWVELLREVGYPAGINHTMTLDLTGKLRPGDAKLRIATNMDLCWDRIVLAAHSADLPVKLTEVAARSADLHALGYPREYSPDGRQPTLFDYSNIDRTDTWLRLPGAYTRYGDVTELTERADDKYVIMAAGDEITVRFPTSRFGPVPEGCVRTFLLKSDSYCKDMDLYTGAGDHVEPLPFHAMKGYPYGSEDAPAVPEDVQRSRETYNTRVIGR
ncbi:FG-GAP-like repeat-containing protein [Aquisphaera insulae]|uniref:FG-GAP-like repeat-containing protein n=1 Tax=Aquisphaera insulae TaxID=2712864 RepID=UPI0013EC9379|nr:FG-GAP-like repeat-containing protein [Aquisphaera insulae]